MKILLYAAVALLVLLAVKIILSPIKTLAKIAINTSLGIISLILFNFAGKYIGVTLGINLFTVIVTASCGPFGLVLLLIIRLLTF